MPQQPIEATRTAMLPLMPVMEQGIPVPTLQKKLIAKWIMVDDKLICQWSQM